MLYEDRTGHSALEGAGWWRTKPLTDEQAAWWEQKGAAMRRQIEATLQMERRSGPYYEASRSRSRIVNEAWKAAGSPRHVRVSSRHGQRVYYVHTAQDVIDVSEDEWQAWRKWVHAREKLRREIGARGASGRRETPPS